MPIVSSTIEEDAEQIDQRRHITERHTEDSGIFHRVSYTATADDDVLSRLPANARRIEAQISAHKETNRLNGVYNSGFGKLVIYIRTSDVITRLALTVEETNLLRERLG